VSGEYVIGAPQIPSMTLSLPGGKRFTSKAVNLGEKNKYVKSVTLNGEPLQGFKLSHAAIMAGGTLEFEMTDEPGQRQ
jgi:putative alpha-1,2-mannosidase